MVGNYRCHQRITEVLLEEIFHRSLLLYSPFICLKEQRVRQWYKMRGQYMDYVGDACYRGSCRVVDVLTFELRN